MYLGIYIYCNKSVSRSNTDKFFVGVLFYSLFVA